MKISTVLLVLVAVTFLGACSKSEQKRNLPHVQHRPTTPPVPPTTPVTSPAPVVSPVPGTPTPPATTPPASTVSAEVRAFNGEWMTECATFDAGSSRAYANYFWINDGTFYEERLWYSALPCNDSQLDQSEFYRGTFTVSGRPSGTALIGARFADVVYTFISTGNAAVPYNRYDLWQADIDRLFMGAYDPAHDSSTPATRPNTLRTDRPYYPYYWE